MRDQPSSERRLEGSLISAMEDFVPVAREQVGTGDGAWLSMARDAFSASTSYFDIVMRSAIEESMSLYRSEHPQGSKYHSPAFAKRSRLFRPKIRAMLRKHEAAVDVALFSTADVVSIQPPDRGNKEQAAAARIQTALVNHRLSTTVPWFKLMIGAYQDCARQGYVVAHTSWSFREGVRYYDEQYSGGRSMRVEEKFVVEDTPKVRLVPVENFRFDPGADWADPVHSSPYLIEMVPMYVHEIKEAAQKQRSLLRYRPLNDGMLRSGLKQSYDGIRMRREGGRTERYQNAIAITDYTIVWVHRNIFRHQGEDYYFETVGTEHLLTDPVPLIEIDPRGYRPYVIGSNVVESHTLAPTSSVQLAKPLQEEINEIANLRIDNTKMATMGRYFVRRGASIDLEALARFTPGATVDMPSPNSDIRWDRAPEVGKQAFEEQNLLQLEMDDILGGFTGSTINANRRLNDNVGSVVLFNENAAATVEYTIRTFVETFVRPLVAQVVDLERLWETDEAIAEIVGARTRASVDQVFRALGDKLDVVVSVGYGSTNPMQRVTKLQMGFTILGTYFPQFVQSADIAEVVAEVFGAMGFSNAERFFPALGGEENPQVAALRKEIDQLKAMLESKELDNKTKIEVANITAKAGIAREQIKASTAREFQSAQHKFQYAIEAMKLDLAKLDLMIEREKSAIARRELEMQREALSHTILMAEREFQLKQQATAIAPPPRAEIDEPDQASQRLIGSLRRPGSGVALDAKDDKAGVIARGKFGRIPFKEG